MAESKNVSSGFVCFFLKCSETVYQFAWLSSWCKALTLLLCEGAAETWAWFCPIFSLQTLFSDSHAHSLSLMLWHFLFSLRFSPSSFWCFTIRKPVSPQRFQSHGKTALSQLQQPKSSCLVNSYLLSTLPTPQSLSVSPPLLSTNPRPSFSF